MSIRLVELYDEGGLPEVQRGVTDWYMYNVKRPVFTQFKDESRIEVGDVSIRWTIDSQESASRAIGLSETVVMEDFVESVQRGEVFWDVGANQGIYSMLAGKCGLHVHAFEPGDRARAILHENAELNDVELDIHPVALDAEAGEKRLSVTGNTGNRSIVSNGEGDIVPVKRGEEISAESPDVLKIDVEGHELPVLDGLGQLLNECRLCYVEVHDDADINEVENRLRDRGIEQIVHLPDPNTIVRAEARSN